MSEPPVGLTFPPHDQIQVLHIDDEEPVRTVTARCLEAASPRITVTSAEDCASMERLLETAPVDCVVSDYHMPSADGFTVFDRVREYDSRIPCLLLTGERGSSFIEEALEVGVADYVEKRAGGGQFDLLAHRIEKAVARTRSSRRADTAILATSVSEFLRTRHASLAELGPICQRIAAQQPYSFAWIGALDKARDRIEITCGATATESEAVNLGTIALADGGPDEIVTTAVTDGGVQTTSQSEKTKSTSWGCGPDQPPGVLAAVPITNNDHVVGILGVSSRSSQFDRIDRALLKWLGRALSTAHPAPSAEQRAASTSVVSNG